MANPPSRPGPSSAVIEVAIADGNPLMLAALAEFFERDSGFSLVSTASTAEGFLEAVERVPVKAAVIDWHLPRMGGERLLDALRVRPGAPRVVVYGTDESSEVVRRAMAAGAAGFCSRSQPPEQLVQVVRQVAGGQMVFPFVDVRDLNRDPAEGLTPRERALLAALARGLNNKELAREFDISLNTVKFHLRNLYDKLAIDSRAQAIAFYYAAGIRGEDER
jgi:two-component system nitrate/nitrite response regulator NarP